MQLIRQEESTLKELSFLLYGKGLSTKETGEVFESFYGRHYSKSTISSFSKDIKKQLDIWCNRKLDLYYPVIYIDAIYTKIRRAGSISSEAFYVVLGLKEDFTREVLSVESIPIESSAGWLEVLRGLKSRGVKDIELVVADGISGLEDVLPVYYPKTKLQKCVTHFKRNILKRLKKIHKDEVIDDLRDVFNMEDKSYTVDAGLKNMDIFIDKWVKHYPFMKNIQRSNTLEYYFTYLNYNHKVKRMIYTTNWIERLNKDYKKVLKTRNSMPNEESVLALLAQVSIDKNNNTYTYPIYNFNYERKFKK